MIDSNRLRSLIAASALGLAAAVGGCSAGDVELNGAVFDYLGVGSKSGGSNNAKVPERQGLVLPPNLERLPEPGSGALAAQQGETMPVDPEQKRVANATQAEAKHRDYCERAMQKARIMKDLSPVNGPLGRCDKSIFDQVNLESPVTMNTTGTNAPVKGLPR